VSTRCCQGQRRSKELEWGGREEEESQWRAGRLLICEARRGRSLGPEASRGGLAAGSEDVRTVVRRAIRAYLEGLESKGGRRRNRPPTFGLTCNLEEKSPHVEMGLIRKPEPSSPSSEIWTGILCGGEALLSIEHGRRLQRPEAWDSTRPATLAPKRAHRGRNVDSWQ
jgi:hypothetical protein